MLQLFVNKQQDHTGLGTSVSFGMRHYDLICPFNFVRRPYFSPTYSHPIQDKQAGTQKKDKIKNVSGEIVSKQITRAFEEVVKVARNNCAYFDL